MAGVVELAVADQTQVGLVNQSRGFERLARFLLGQMCGGEAAQLVVDERQFWRGSVAPRPFSMFSDVIQEQSADYAD
jgi:hypothetical protein